MRIRRCDLKAPEEHLIEALVDIDVVISCVGPAEQQDQIPLAKAAKKVGVKRFIPCGFITVAPPGGIMWLRDEVRDLVPSERIASLLTSRVISERDRLQPDPPDVAPLHHRRCRLVVPAGIPSPCLWTCRLCHDVWQRRDHW